MSARPNLDNVLSALVGNDQRDPATDIMDGVWQRAGQLSEISAQRQRMTLFAGVFFVGLTAGAGATGIPFGSDTGTASALDFATADQLSPTTLLEGAQ